MRTLTTCSVAPSCILQAIEPSRTTHLSIQKAILVSHHSETTEGCFNTPRFIYSDPIQYRTLLCLRSAPSPSHHHHTSPRSTRFTAPLRAEASVAGKYKGKTHPDDPKSDNAPSPRGDTKPNENEKTRIQSKDRGQGDYNNVVGLHFAPTVFFETCQVKTPPFVVPMQVDCSWN